MRSPSKSARLLPLAALVSSLALLIPATSAFADGGALDGLSPVSPEMPAGPSTPTLPANLRDTAGKVATLDLWTPAGKPKELDKVKASKDYKSAGWSAALVDPRGGSHDLATQQNVELKGRGNNTWCSQDNGRGGKFCNAKIPLQVKFDTKVDLIDDYTSSGVKNSDNANKSWVLLPNYADASLMRNKFAFDLADSLGMKFTPESRWVDVRMDGKYMGNYLLAEKVEVKKGRTNLKNDAGLIVELDNNYYDQEPFTFEANNGSHFVLKDAKAGDSCDTQAMAGDPSYQCVPGNSKVTADKCSAAPVLNPAYAAQNAAEPDPTKRKYLDQNKNCLPAVTLAAWNSAKASINTLSTDLAQTTPDWTTITNELDVDSFLRYYFLADVIEDAALVKSSIYFYKDGDSDKWHAGPAWDFDTTIFNRANGEEQGSYPQADYAKNTYMLRVKTPVKDKWGYYRPANPWYDQLYRNPEFASLTNQMWTGTGAYAGKTPVRDLTTLVTGRINNYWTQLVGTNRGALGSAADNFSLFKILGKKDALVARTYASTYGGEVTYLCSNIAQRVAFLGRDYGDIPLLRVKAGVAGMSGLPWVNNGQVAGTVIDGKQLEDFKWDLNGANGVAGWTGDGGISASAKLAKGGTVSVTNEKAATLGKSGVAMIQWKMSLTGALAESYRIQYRAKLSSGWQSWRNADEWAGSTSGNRLEAVQVRLLLPESTTGAAAPCDNFKALEATARATASPDQLFKDVTPETSGFRQINWLGATGIATGTAITDAAGNKMTLSFSPTKTVTREQLAAWLYRYAHPAGYVAPTTSPFSDVKTSSANYTAVAWLYESHLTGDSAGKFRPTENVSRAKVAAVLMRLAQALGTVPADYAPPAGASPYKDVKVSDSHYPPIRWLDANGVMTSSSGKWNPSGTVTRADFAKYLLRYATIVAASSTS